MSDTDRVTAMDIMENVAVKVRCMADIVMS